MRRATVAFVAVVLAAGCFETPAASGSHQVSPSSSQPQIVLYAGPSQASGVFCADQSLAWATSTNTDPKQFKFDVILAWTGGHHSPGAIASPLHGGVISLHGLSSNGWAVWLEYQQVGFEQRWNYWYLVATNIATTESKLLDFETDQPAASELPMVSVDSTLVVWDRMTAAGTKLLKVVDLSNNGSPTIFAFPGVRPTWPRVHGDSVIFLDNATDPHASTQINTTRGGHLMLLRRSSGALTKLDSEDDARQPAFNGSLVAWHGQGAQGDFTVNLSGVDGSPSKRISPIGFRAALSLSHLVWTGPRGTYDYSLETSKAVRIPDPILNDGSWAPTYALCGNDLYYSPPKPSEPNHPIWRYHLSP